ncbi:long-chain-fatty-acid-CoA ligase [Microsporum canis CBS 113480]|uniref:Long-chain-fatty-acid-CoA ligase n=1 Tax=Arthroderma otae (strain ATCC MYA-4605 / CBS 113480) TaxID=554155 RepID=C5FG40_ARTOC|nr:long-chain-fatty-acid-CoA ligase [Microsporum canis CBS 113480]EEQ29725.1 long-chain-fatty-acid-CoA ligase [Microsporum canis CBS 113480]
MNTTALTLPPSLPSLPLFLEAQKWASKDPGKIAIIDKSKDLSFTYRQLLNDVSILKRRILAEVKVQDLEERRVAFLVPAGYDYVVCQWAVWAAGGVCVPLCTSHPPKELLYTISDSDPSLVVLHTSFQHLKPSLLDNPSDASFMELSPVTESRGCTSIPNLHPAFDLSRRALMIYTSGTTANPKGCVTTHKTITFQATSLIQAWKYSQSDHLIHVLPLHHIHGIINGLTATLLSGGIVEMYAKFDPRVVWDRWSNPGSSTMFMAVPTVYSRLVDYFDANIRSTDTEAAARSGAGALRLVVSGSAALPTPIRTKFLEISGQTLLERYGMTEIGMGLSCGLDVSRRIEGSVGWPLPGVQVRLTHRETGIPIPASSCDEDGMIEIKGDNVFLEYWRRPDATASEFTSDGWFKTGDVARRDSAGAYYIQGRASVDLIKSGGYKISALEVERKMLALEEVQEVAVVGIADNEWGQRVAAVVKQREGTTTLELHSLRAKLKSEMATYKIPSVLKLVDSIERNAMGKVNKKMIVKKYWPDLA